MNDIKGLLASLLALDSVSGREGIDKEGLLRLATPLFDEVYEDKLGSFAFIKRSGKKNAPRLLIDAHFDKIGMMVSEICEGGFLAVCAIGGLDTRVLPAAEVTVHAKRDIYGVLTSVPPHISGERSTPKMTDIYIDTGYTAEELKEIVSVGDIVTLRGDFEPLGESFVTSAGLDDKACLAAIFDMIGRTDASSLCFDVYVTASAQEETGKNGARLLAYDIKPDIAVITDVNFACGEDIDTSCSIEIDKGACVDISALTDRRLTKSILRLCEQRKIPHSPICEPTRTSTNNDGVSVCGRGVKTALVGIPIKSMHTPSEVASINDICALSRILEAVACTKIEDLI